MAYLDPSPTVSSRPQRRGEPGPRLNRAGHRRDSRPATRGGERRTPTSLTRRAIQRHRSGGAPRAHHMIRRTVTTPDVCEYRKATRTERSMISPMNEDKLLERITTNPEIFGGKPIVRGRRLAVEHVLGMLAAGDDIDTILAGYAWLEREDVLACLAYAHRLVGHERVEPKVA